VLCLSNLRQNGTAHTAYKADYDGYYPDFGGEPTFDSNGKYRSRSGAWKSPMQINPDAGGLVYLLNYLGGKTEGIAYDTLEVAYSPAIPRDLAISPAPPYGRYTNRASADNGRNALGYFFITGHKLFTDNAFIDFDTRPRRNDPREILVSEAIAHGTGAFSGGWEFMYSPHEHRYRFRSESNGPAHHLLADGSASTFKAGQTWGSKMKKRGSNACLYGVRTPAPSDIANTDGNSRTTGQYYRAPE
jgi:hypothetical protein